MWIYAGMFVIAFSTLVFEITLTRLLSVVAWYHMAFFAVATAMLGMTAAAVRVYLNPKRFSPERVQLEAYLSCIAFALCVPVSLVLLCLIPIKYSSQTVYLLGIVVSTVACALPFYFSGTAISLLLTRSREAKIGKLYASDLFGASLGCLFVLFALGYFDAPSLLIFAGSLGALAGFLMLLGSPLRAQKWKALVAFCALAVVSLMNTSQHHGLRPLIVKGRIEPRAVLFEKWNSFSRVAAYEPVKGPPHLWGPSPVFNTDKQAVQFPMKIDGDAGTMVYQFESIEDIDHFRYDVTSVAYQLRRQGRVCVLGVGGGRDIQCAILFGHENIVGVELNPILIEYLKGPFYEFSGLNRYPSVEIVEAEARGYLSTTRDKYALLQMSLIDTWAATGAGAFSLSENGLYTVEAWKIFLNRLSEDGIYTVSRWHNENDIGETGRAVSLAVAALLEMGIESPRQHIALVTSGTVSTLLVCRSPFSVLDIHRLKEVCTEYQFKQTIIPGEPVSNEILQSIVSATSREDLLEKVREYPLNFEPSTDENPYFFNMLRPDTVNLKQIFMRSEDTLGVMNGNLAATATLMVLISILFVLAMGTIVIPLLIYLPKEKTAKTNRSHVLAGALYFSLIGAGFMFLEIGLIQKLSLYLSHPIYALGIILFTIIAATGLGSFWSEKLPLLRKPWLFVYPACMVLFILITNVILKTVIASTIEMALSVKIAFSIIIIAPMGVILGLFFPTGMRLFKPLVNDYTPWFWALNGVFGVLSSTLAVFISIFHGISKNFYIAAFCYAAVLMSQLIFIKRLDSPALEYTE
jgi:hypothetical protein